MKKYVRAAQTANKLEHPSTNEAIKDNSEYLGPIFEKEF